MSIDQNDLPPQEPTGPAPGHGPIPPSGVHPDLLDYARATLNMDEIMASIRDYEVNGGQQLKDFIGEIEARALGK